MALPMIIVQVVGGPCGRRQAVFQKARVVIGRGKSDAGEPVDFALDEDLSVSRVQAVLLFEGGRWRVENRSRHKSTVVKGRYGEALALADGDVIDVGREGTRIQIQTKLAGDHDGRRPSMGWRTLAALAGGVVLVISVVIGLIMGFGGEPKETVPVGNPRLLAVEARNRGDLTNAMTLLEPVFTNSEENAALYREYKTLSRRFEQARHLEAVLQLDRALDEWRLLSIEGLTPTDPLRAWVQTSQVERLERKLSERGR